MEESKPNSDLFTVSEIAHRLRVKDATVRRWIKQGGFSEDEIVTLPQTGTRQTYRIKPQALIRLGYTTI